MITEGKCMLRSSFGVLLTNSLGKCMETSLEILHVEIGA